MTNAREQVGFAGVRKTRSREHVLTGRHATGWRPERFDRTDAA